MGNRKPKPRAATATTSPWRSHGDSKCAECGKDRFSTRKYAKRVARARFPGQLMRVYKCGNYWHLTSVSARDVSFQREAGLSATLLRKRQRERAKARRRLAGAALTSDDTQNQAR